MKEGHSAVAVATNAHRGLDVVRPVPIGRKLQDHAIQVHAVVVAYRALKLLAQDVVEVIAEKRHEGGSRRRGRYRELGVVGAPIASLQTEWLEVSEALERIGV